MRHFVANLVLALAFMALTGLWSLPGFLLGFVAGIIALSLLPSPLPVKGSKNPPIRYATRLWRIGKLIAMFLRELVLSAFKVASLVVKTRLELKSGLFAFPLTVDRDFEITLLANLITLTPGTLSVDISDDRTTLYVHAIDCVDPDQARADIENGFERAILEAFR